MLDVLLGVIVLLVAVASLRRLLGIERGGWWEVLGAYLLAGLGTGVVVKLVYPHPTRLTGLPVLGALALLIAFSMLAVALLELLRRPARRRRSRGVPHPVRSVRMLARRTTRYAQVSRILVRRGAFRWGQAGDEVAGARLGKGSRVPSRTPGASS